MKLWLSFLFLAASVFAQITVTSDQGAGWTCVSLACSTSERQHGTAIYPVHYNITGSGTISVGTITGTGASGLTTSVCAVGSDPCSVVTTAPADFYAYYDNFTDDTLSPNAYTASIPVTGGSGGSFTLTINLTILALVPPAVVTPSGSTTGCSNTNAFFIDQDTCTVPNLRPTGTYSFAAVGSSITDSNFGGTVYTVATNVPPNTIAVDPAYATSFNITAGSWSASGGGTATLTIGSGHGIACNASICDTVRINGTTPSGYVPFDRTVAVTAVASTTISYHLPSNPGAWSSGGTVTKNPVLAFDPAACYQLDSPVATIGSGVVNVGLSGATVR